jgi:ribosomal protein S18 acetylase RimI-like enzyme
MVVRINRHRRCITSINYHIFLLFTLIYIVVLAQQRFRQLEALVLPFRSPLKNERFLTSSTTTDYQRRPCYVHSNSLLRTVLSAIDLTRETQSESLPRNLNATDVSPNVDITKQFHVRDCKHAELSLVADIIMDSFYNYTDPGSVWKQLTKLAELNRIQQNFPYGDDRANHRMMVITTNCNTSNIADIICGFVDIDTRLANRPTSYKYNPRPYLSDLCIHPNYRRYGLATMLISACENYCRSHSVGQRKDIPIDQAPELYIRVESQNVVAINMYQKLGYSVLLDHADSGNKNILILYKLL